jgi:hypothetical protein
MFRRSISSEWVMVGGGGKLVSVGLLGAGQSASCLCSLGGWIIEIEPSRVGVLLWMHRGQL